MRRAPKLPPDREHLEEAGAEAPAKPRRRRGHDYEVGFARPPKATRWKPGQTGNPRGRPKKKPDFLEALDEVLKETMTATIEGERKTVTIRQALLFRLREEALGGDRACMKLQQKILAAAPEPQPPEVDMELTRIMIDLQTEQDPEPRTLCEPPNTEEGV